jgi:signal transduction histidine kinase
MRQFQAQRIGYVGSAVPEAERELPAIEESGAARYVAPAPETEAWPIGSIFRAAYSPQPLSDKLLAILQAVCQETHSNKAFLLRYESTTNAVSLVAGTAPLDVYEALTYSRLRDIYEGKTLVAYETSGSSTLTRLLALLEAKSLIGVPVKVGDRTDHALLLCGQPTSEDSSSLMSPIVCASLLGQCLTRAALEEVLRHSSDLIRLGQLTQMFLHEVKNRFGHLSLALLNLQYLVSGGERAGEPNADTETDIRTQVQRIIDLTQQAGQQMNEWYHLRQSNEHLLACNVLLSNVIYTLRPLADEARIMLDLEASKAIMRTLLVRPVLRQVLTGLVQHSIEDVAIAQRSRQNVVGKVVISAGYDSQSRALDIRVMDNGLGIHRKHWNTMFEAGFSTRVNDPGLGLYIARVITESLGGRILVEDSIILGGTTFQLSIPTQVATQPLP